MISVVLPGVDLVRSCVVLASEFGSRMCDVANIESPSCYKRVHKTLLESVNAISLSLSLSLYLLHHMLVKAER